MKIKISLIIAVFFIAKSFSQNEYAGLPINGTAFEIPSSTRIGIWGFDYVNGGDSDYGVTYWVKPSVGTGTAGNDWRGSGTTFDGVVYNSVTNWTSSTYVNVPKMNATSKMLRNTYAFWGRFSIKVTEEGWYNYQYRGKNVSVSGMPEVRFRLIDPSDTTYIYAEAIFTGDDNADADYINNDPLGVNDANQHDIRFISLNLHLSANTNYVVEVFNGAASQGHIGDWTLVKVGDIQTNEEEFKYIDQLYYANRTLHFNTNRNNSVFEIDIFDINGRLINHYNKISNSFAQVIKLDKGVYMIIATSNEKQISSKILVK